MVLALSYVKVIEEKGSYDADTMAETIPQVTVDYSEGKYGVYPVTGTIKLNEWNDRASGDYAIYYVTEECKWDKAGTWIFDDNKIEWAHKPEAPAPPATTPAEQKRTPGFEFALAVVGVLAGAYLIRRRQ